ncbi:translation initiation factor 2 [Bacillus sp. JCM 19047]|uniref:Translation initiation factor IF-2 n=1 Tax=Shouchella miscanthi TaxID=2598861 RepID=A0ABU6NGB3_9BACI|nr:translation initiation factor IF-2 [Shouchella miscanthi]MED4127257.1 translation initiation factor IF-2 [Shouchella miscanthi]GAF24263.1 translation initiation factor 2 [Bacillus sp. JCM 19047]
MSKMRIHEYAKANNVQSKQLIEKLKAMGETVSNHMSTVEEETLKKANLQVQASGGNGDQKSMNKKTDDRPNDKKPAGQEQRGAQKQGNATQGGNRGPNNRTQGNRPGGGGNRTQGRPGNNNRRNQGRGKKRGGPQNRPNHQQMPLPEKIMISGSLSVSELAAKLHREASELIKKLMKLGVMATINQELDKDTIELLAADYGVAVEEEVFVDELDIELYDSEDKEEELQERPPVVTIMGHVDHGKTTLLDSIRNTKVTAGEAGGITQHIGAYQIEQNNKKITFLDTPGHAAFTTMRARGAQVTDIAIIVVAADDGVMPQTKEAISHAKAAEVPIIIAVNKMDKETANPDRVMQELTEYELVPEAWGGDTIFVNVSALNGDGIDELIEMILLVSEVEELKANPDKLATGTVVEAQLDKGRGPVATLLVQSGTLNVGDAVVVGSTFGRVRALVNDLGRRVKTVGPSAPVEITGLNEVPQAGDRFQAFKDEKKARQVGEGLMARYREQNLSETSKVSLDDLFNQIQQGDIKDINVIIKADVQGSVEAMKGSLEKIDVAGVKVNIIHTGAGAITESDIILASASNAIVIGFNVRPDVNAKRVAEAENVDIRLHRVIYNAIDEIEQAMKGALDPEFEEKVIGQVEVRTTFKVSKIGTIAGSYVTEGKITRNSAVRLIRDGIVVYEGELNALKRFKDDAKEVAAGYECGITLEKFNDIKEGDIIEAYVMEEVKR